MAHTEFDDDFVSHSPFDPRHLAADLMAGLGTFLVALPPAAATAPLPAQG